MLYIFLLTLLYLHPMYFDMLHFYFHLFYIFFKFPLKLPVWPMNCLEVRYLISKLSRDIFLVFLLTSSFILFYIIKA